MDSSLLGKERDIVELRGVERGRNRELGKERCERDGVERERERGGRGDK